MKCVRIFVPPFDEFHNLADSPPAATIVSPVMKLASSDTKNATTLPISSGMPSLPIGILFNVAFLRASDL